MKKLFLFAAAVAMMTACSESDVLEQGAGQALDGQGGVTFDVYAQRGVARGGGFAGDITNKTIVGADRGFGVFAYYTAGKKYGTAATPNFMYNQQVYTTAAEATYGAVWKYEPVKYWPNEYGKATSAGDVDYVSFFAYAPWTDVEPTTGDVKAKAAPADWTGTAEQWLEREQHYNIIGVNNSTETGDPLVKYVVDTDPATSVDLLWGVAAQNAAANYTPIDGKEGTTKKNAAVELTPGQPFLNLVKPNDPAKDKLVYNLKHALAKVRVTIDYIADYNTPNGGTYPPNTNVTDMYGGSADAGKTGIINADETRIWLRQFNISGWAIKGALNLNNSEAGEGLPYWKTLDGTASLGFDEEKYQDGLKDGSEGQGKIDKGESLTGLNPCLLEDAAVNTAETTGDYAGQIVKFARRNAGIGAMTVEGGKLKIEKEVALQPNAATVQAPASSGGTLTATGAVGTTLLFGGNPAKNGGYFYVIPRNQGQGVDVKIFYDVETIDPNLMKTLSDKVTKGSSIENIITKENIFGEGVDFEPGKQYDIHIHVGMVSAGVDATVHPWIENDPQVIDLPEYTAPEEDPTPMTEPEVPGSYFTANSSGLNVAFSQGNLQATTTNGGTNWTWAFAAHQWDYVGNVAANNAITGNKTVSANGTVEFFCWSTASTYYGIHNSQDGNTYSGDFKDWGTLSISNGGGYTWRTLTSAEWKHIFNDRTSGATVNGTTDARWTHATINTDGTAVNGIILFPDGCKINSSSATWGTINGNSAWGTKCTKAQWSHLESLGCVFLPAAGSRHGSGVSYMETMGCYWSATPTSGTHANLVEFGENSLNSTLDYWRDHGRSVRLVRDIAAPAPANKLLSAATAEDIGKVVCAAGHLHDANTAVPAGCTAVGILGKVTATGQGLILALQDATSQSWNTINGWASVTTYAGTTLKLLPDNAARGTNLTSYTTLGSVAVSDWCVAQKSDYEAIFTNLGSTAGDTDGITYDANVNTYITTGVGGTPISGAYWSATGGFDSLRWAFDSDDWYLDDKGVGHSLRPVLGF